MLPLHQKVLSLLQRLCLYGLRKNFFKKTFYSIDLKNMIKIIILMKTFFFSDHHLSHAASAFFPSPFDEAIVLTADGVGEWATTTIAQSLIHI